MKFGEVGIGFIKPKGVKVKTQAEYPLSPKRRNCFKSGKLTLKNTSRLHSVSVGQLMQDPSRVAGVNYNVSGAATGVNSYSLFTHSMRATLFIYRCRP